MNNDCHKNLLLLLNISRDMCQASDGSDWELLFKLQPQRKALVAKLFSDEKMAAYPRSSRPILREIWDLDQHLVRTCKTDRDRLFQNASEIKKGRQAARKYQEHTTRVV